MEYGVLAFSTGALQLIKTIHLIGEGVIETQDFSLSDEDRTKVIVELLNAIRGERPLIRLVTSRDLDVLDPCRRVLHENLSQGWASLVEWNDDDRLMLYEASLAYARYGIVKTKSGICKPKPMILVTDDRQIHRIAEDLDEKLKNAVLSTPGAQLTQTQYRTRIIYVATYAQLKELIRKYTQ